MAAGIWCKKIGMTQLFKGEKVVPVTIMDVSNWVVIRIKNMQNDSYDSIQVGRIKDKFVTEFSKDKISEWVKEPKKYFVAVKEVKGTIEGAEAGDNFNWTSVLAEGQFVNILGRTIGKGFAGTVKRHGFAGGSNSHGDKLGRKSGSLSFMRSRGRVIKGKRLPGHLGNENCVVRGLEVIKIDPASNYLAVKGSVPGKSGSLLYVSKQG